MGAMMPCIFPMDCFIFGRLEGDRHEEGLRLVECRANAKPDTHHEQESKAGDKRSRELERKAKQQDEFVLRKRQRKREQRQRTADSRRELLHSMSPEERAAFLEREKVELAARQQEEETCVRRAYEVGKPQIVINCSFSGVMDTKELRSLAKQLQNTKTLVRNLHSPFQLHVTSLYPGNPVVSELEKLSFEKWLMHFHHGDVWEAFDLERVVVLSPDAEEDLDEVREDHIYVIGGLVDRRIIKNQTKFQAEANGVVTVKKLPIKTLGPPGMYPVLNIDIVVAILHERLIRGPQSDWREILLHCIPQRHQPGPTRRMKRKERARAAGDAVSKVSEAFGSSSSDSVTSDVDDVGENLRS